MEITCRTEELFGNYYNQVLTLDYKALILWVKACIECVDNCIAQCPQPEPGTYEYACKSFAVSIIEYAKAANDNIIMGHLKVANILNRTIIENYACLRVIHDYKKEELWKYWIAHSFYNTPRKYSSEDIPEDLKEHFKNLCESLDIDQAFVDDKKSITKKYSWMYGVSKNYNFRGLCNLLDQDIYGDFQMMSEFTHGTSVFQKEYTFSFESSIYNTLSAIYSYLHYMMVDCFAHLIDEDFALCDYKLGKIFERLVKDE